MFKTSLWESSNTQLSFKMEIWENVILRTAKGEEEDTGVGGCGGGMQKDKKALGGYLNLPVIQTSFPVCETTLPSFGALRVSQVP